MFEVEVQLELGHKATPKPKISADGYTHDWTVFVRGSENSEIEHFIDKVVFNLHESFPKHKRVIREPPYEVCESGYAGFELPIDVYFKNKEEPKKVSFEYDLYLRVDEAVSNTRREKLTFKNPSNDFKKKLLKANGVLHDKSGLASNYGPSSHEKVQTYNSKGNKSSHSYNECRKSSKSSVIPSKDKAHQSQHLSSSLSSSTSAAAPTLDKPSAPPALQNQFTDLFGTPIQPKPSPESAVYKSKQETFSSKAPVSSGVNVSSKKSQKERTSDYKRSSSYETEKKHKSSKSVKTEKTNSESSNSRKEISKSKLSKSASSKSSETKSTKQPSTGNDTSQRDKKSSSNNESSKSGSKKRRRSSSSASSSFTSSSVAELKKEKEHSSKSIKDQADHKKESKKHRSSKDITSTNNASGNSSSHKSKDVKKESSTSTTISFSNNNNTGTTTLEIKSVKKEKTWDSEVKKSKNKEQKNDEMKTKESSSKESSKSKGKEELRSPKPNSKFLKVPKEKLNTAVSQREVSSSPASILSGSLTPGGATCLGAPLSVSSVNGPMASINADIEQESLSPLSSGDPISPFVHSSHKDMEFSDDDSSGNERHILTNNKSRVESKHSSVGESVDKRNCIDKSHQQMDTSSTIFDASYVTELMSLQRKLNDLTDRDIVQKVVDTIEESGLFSITNTSVDFDLMKLDKTTVKKLKMCLAT